jgi:hypothetical protein
MFDRSTLVDLWALEIPRGLQPENLDEAFIFSLQFLDLAAKISVSLKFFLVHADPDAPPHRRCSTLPTT